MSDELQGTQTFALRQVADRGFQHYISAGVERNSKGFTTSVKATITTTSETLLTGSDAVFYGETMRDMQGLLLAAAQLNVEHRKLIIVRSENQSDMREAVAIAAADFNLWMDKFTAPLAVESGEGAV